MDLTFNKLIPFNDSIQLINEVYDTVFDFDEMGNIIYLPELYDYAFRLAVAKFYAGYALSDDETNYITAMSFDPYNTEIDTLQLSGIEKALTEKIELQKSAINQSNVTVTSQFDELIPCLLKLFNAVADKVSSTDMKKISKLMKELNVENIVKIYLDSTLAKNNYGGVINEKNDKIHELQNLLNSFTTRNV